MPRYPSLETREGAGARARGQGHQAALIRSICACIGGFSRSLAWVMSQHDALATNYSRAAVDRRKREAAKEGAEKILGVHVKFIMRTSS